MTTRIAATFCVKVWWMHGWPIGRIASWSGWTTGQVRGVIHRAFDTPREQMTVEERQAVLDNLKTHRLDDGALKDDWFVAQPLAAAQTAERFFPVKEKPVEPVLPPKQAEKRAREKRQREAQERSERERGHATARGVDGAAFEWMNARKILADPPSKSTHGAQSDGSGVRRLTCGLKLRAYFDGARIGGLNSVDYERSGGGGTPGQTASAHRLECISAIGAIRKAVAGVDPAAFAITEMVVDHDRFVFHEFEGQDRAECYERIRMALDVVAMHLGLMDERAFFARWKAHPRLERAFDRRDARSVEQVARDLLRSAKV